MTHGRFFSAPWSPGLRVVTGLTCASLVVVAALGLGLNDLPLGGRLTMLIAPPLFAAAGALFGVRGFEVMRPALLIWRPGWKTVIPLHDLRSVTVDAEATSRSIRWCGNGGFFAFTGWFSNKRLGRYRLFGTDPARAVVLEFPKRKVVVTPDDPQGLARCLREAACLK